MKNRKFRIAALAFAVVAALLVASCDIVGSFFEDPAPSSDATLRSLSLSVGTLSPAFSKDIVSYATTAPTETASLTVFATATDSGATVAGAGSVTLGAPGSTTSVEITVSAADGVATKTYSIDITRAAPAASSEARLATLEVSFLGIPVTLDPAFASDTFAYSIGDDVPYAYRNLTVTVTALDSGATVSGDGAWALSVGANEKTITVTAADGVTQQAYTISATLYGEESAYLSVLELSGFHIGFDPWEMVYAINVPSGTTSVHLSATPEYPGSTLEYSDDNGATWTTYTSAVDIAVGPDETTTYIEVHVTSEFGTYENYYEIDVTVAAESASNVATLASLALYDWESTPIILSPDFASNTFAYTASVGSMVDRVELMEYSTTDPLATVADLTPFDLVPGPNTLDIVVIAADGVSTETYSIVITRVAPPTITITSPAEGATIDTTTFTVSGTYSDPNGEIDSIVFTFDGSTILGTASPDGMGGFTAELDASSATNGTKPLYAIAQDAFSNMIAMTSVTIDFSAGVTGYTVSFPVNYSGTIACDGYLALVLLLPDMSGSGGMLTGIPVSSTDFPYSASIEGVLPGDYIIYAMVTATSDPAGTAIYESDMIAGVPVTVVDADVVVSTTTMMYAP